MQQERHDSALILFARYPRPGRVKTRLAKAIGNTEACEVYRRCLMHVSHQAQKTTTYDRLIISAADEDDICPLRRLLGNGFEYVEQCAGSIGDRMDGAFTDVFQVNTGRAVLTGTDIPSLDADSLDEANRALDTNGFVLGSAADGGYYLIGMKQPAPWLFDGIAWSTGSVFSDSLSRIKEREHSCRLAPILQDIDTQVHLRDWYCQQPDTSNHLLYAHLAENDHLLKQIHC